MSGALSGQQVKTFCELYTKCILPAVRALLAKKLIQDYSMTQTEVAKLFGISQAAINYYLHGRRCGRLVSSLEEEPLVRDFVERMAEEVAKGRVKNFGVLVCQLCKAIRSDERCLRDFLGTLGIKRENLLLP